MGHQSRCDWNFAFDHGTLWNPSPSKSGFLCNRMRVKPKMRQDFRLASVSFVQILEKDISPKGILSISSPLQKRTKLARYRALLTSSCYLRVDETMDLPIKTRSFKKIFWMFCWRSGNLKLTKCHSVDVFCDTRTRVHRFHRCKNWKAKNLDAPFLSILVVGSCFCEEFSKESIRLGWCLMFFFCFLAKFTNTPTKTNECPSKKGHFKKKRSSNHYFSGLTF